MFKSSKGALLFAGLVVLGAVSLVGVEDDPGTVVETSDGISRQKAELDAMMAEEDEHIAEALDEVSESDEWFESEVEYADDEELIDDASGFDPVPMIDASVPDVDRTEDDVILLEDG
ncbi:hypothetical protein [Altererythrobacter sp. MF3-039]|uniref:hypothetical protein n=1 Tax=Altererythrobacter sp. MF3-039 TaxID=3252901 RepID=UPI00390C78B4